MPQRPALSAPSAQVRDLQSALTARGFNPGSADGIFGPKTDAAVRAFQQANGLAVDGIVGPQTLAALSRQQARQRWR
jgi:peptidoglycan hydrolase-like protein with peptidoglycan-binding domain